jgi:hypothetical protein
MIPSPNPQPWPQPCTSDIPSSLFSKITVEFSSSYSFDITTGFLECVGSSNLRGSFVLNAPADFQLFQQGCCLRSLDLNQPGEAYIITSSVTGSVTDNEGGSASVTGDYQFTYSFTSATVGGVPQWTMGFSASSINLVYTGSSPCSSFIGSFDLPSNNYFVSLPINSILGTHTVTFPYTPFGATGTFTISVTFA